MQRKIILIILIILICFNFFSFQQQDDILNETEILIKEGNFSKALSILLTELSKNPDSSKIAEKAGSIFFSQQVYDLALKYYLLAYKNGEKDVPILEKIGESYAYLNENKKAINYLKQAFYMGNSDPYYLYSLIWLFLKEKKFDEAYTFLDIGNSIYPNLSYFTGAKALYYANTFDIENARKEYNKALLSTASYSPIYYYNWGVMEYQLRNFIDAEYLFSGAASFSNFGEAFLALGEISLNKADLNSAESYFLKGKPLLKSPFILYDLIYLYSLKGEKSKLISVYKSIMKFPNKWWVYQYNLNMNEQMTNFYELESFYFDNLKKLERKSFYPDYKSRIKSRIYSLYYSLLAFISRLKLRYYATLHLMNIDREKESLTFLQVTRKIITGFPFIEKNLLLKEKKLYEKITLKDGYIYELYYSKLIKNKEKKLRFIDDFLRKSDAVYENLDILNALELKAKIYKKDNENYLKIIGQMVKIQPYYFNNCDLKIPANISFSGDKKSIRIVKSYLKAKGVVYNKNSSLRLNINCADVYTFSIDYNEKSNFFSLTKEDVLTDRIPIYSNLLGILIDE